MCGQVGLCGESARLALTDTIQFTLKLTAELVKLPPQIPVTVLEPGFSLGLAALALPHPLDIYGDLGFGIKGNPLPQFQKSQ